MKRIFAFIVTVAAVLAFAPGIRAQVVTDKWVSGPNSNGVYTLTLESYVTGHIDETTDEKATDFVLALDYSGSMDTGTAGKDPVFNPAETKKAETSGQRISETKSASTATAGYWTYSNIKYGNSSGTANLQWYYREGSEAPYTYYPVYRVNNLKASDGTNTCRALYIMKGSTRWYLQPNGDIEKTYVNTNTSNSKKLFVGTLYKGWSYSTYTDADGNTTYTGAYDNKSHYYSRGLTANATGTANSQYYYYDADKVLYTTSYYYPVMKANNLPDNNGGNTARAFYVERSGVRKYLNLQGKLVDSYDKTITTDHRTITFAKLYRGWTYSTITAALNDGTTTGDAGGHWIKYSTDALGNAAYYPLQKETLSDANKKYQVFFIDRNGVKRYLRAISTTPSTSPCAYSAGTSVTLFMGNLYTVKEWKDYNRFEGLTRAVAAFAEGVYKHANKDPQKPISHRIAMIAWGSPRWITTLENPNDGYHHPASTESNTSWTGSNKKIPTNARNINRPFMRALSAAGKPSRGARILMDFKNMANATSGANVDRGDKNLAAIKAEFDTYPTNYHEATCIEFGMGISQALFDREWRGRDYASQAGYDGTSTVQKDYDGSGAWETWEDSSLSSSYYKKSQYKRPKTLIVVSDGGFNGYDWDNFTTAGATTEIGKASINRAKEFATAMKADGIKIYFIHVAASNPNANEKAMATSADYCIRADSYGKPLIDAMMTIVNKIDVADIQLDAQAVVQDIVTPEFTVPSGSTIKTYTANCTGVNSEGDYTWSGRTAFTSTTSITPNSDDGTTKVTVQGFDYATNWVGLHSSGTYSGKKLLIEIPIVPDPSLIGGDRVYTNTTESIILDKPGGKEVADFPRPQLGPFPINLRVEKTGLLEGESAVFAIYRKPVNPASSIYETTPYLTFVLTGKADGSAAVAEITGLDASYYYKIKETTWSWKYDSEVTEISTEEQTMNPFRFANNLRTDGTPKNGEDIQQNKFF